MKHRAMVLAVLAALVAACSSTPVRIGPRPPDAYQVIGPVEASACGVLLYDFIPIVTNSCVDRAYRNAILRKNATMLIDTEVRDRWYFIGLGQLLCTDIRGTAIVSPLHGGEKP
jgi:hypothetical protein